MKIGILGGTFDPPHIGHLVIGEQAYVQLGLDRVWFMPVGQPSHKNNQQVSAVIHRANMTRLAIRDNPHFDVSLIDAERPTPHYTLTLMDLLIKQHPEWQWELIIGSDSLIELPRWYQPQQLLHVTRLAVAHRPGMQPDLAELETILPGISQCIDWIDSPLIDLASHDLQHRIHLGQSLRYMTTIEVLTYIQENHLYTENEPQSG